MKKIVSVTEVDGEGLPGLLGENVLIMCGSYFYAGTLAGVNDTCVLLENAKVVFDTGAYRANDWTTAESLPGPWYVQTAAIESFGKSGK